MLFTKPVWPLIPSAAKGALEAHEQPGNRRTFRLIGNCQTIQLPNYSGIYFLCRGTTPVYVGKSTNIAQRLADHFQDKAFDSIKVMAVPVELLDVVETYWINRLQPELNRKGRFRAQEPIRLDLQPMRIGRRRLWQVKVGNKTRTFTSKQKAGEFVS